MHTTTKILTTLALSLTIAGSVNANSFEATNNSITTQICIAAVEDNKSKLRNTIKENRLAKSYVSNEIKCNDLHIMEFVAKYSKSPAKINNLLSKYKKKTTTHVTVLAKL